MSPLQGAASSHRGRETAGWSRSTLSLQQEHVPGPGSGQNRLLGTAARLGPLGAAPVQRKARFCPLPSAERHPCTASRTGGGGRKWEKTIRSPKQRTLPPNQHFPECVPQNTSLSCKMLHREKQMLRTFGKAAAGFPIESVTMPTSMLKVPKSPAAKKLLNLSLTYPSWWLDPSGLSCPGSILQTLEPRFRSV